MVGEQFLTLGVPSGVVDFFNGAVAAIPLGWTEQTVGRGRYIVGMPASGTLGATVGTALSDQENRPAGQHTHPIIDPGHSHSERTQSGGVGASVPPGSASGAPVTTGTTTTTNTTGVTTDNPTGSIAGTPAPYVQYVCIQKS